jgi:hypothetical protein
MDGHLKRKGVPFLKAPSREYNVLAGIFANGILSLRSSNEMARMVEKVRRELPNRCIPVLSQLVTYDCSKRLTSDTRFGTALNSPSDVKEKSHYRFPGNSRALSAEEARGLIYHSITAKNIQMRWAEPVASCILRGIRIRSPYSVREIRFHMD